MEIKDAVFRRSAFHQLIWSNLKAAFNLSLPWRSQWSESGSGGLGSAAAISKSRYHYSSLFVFSVNYLHYFSLFFSKFIIIFIIFFIHYSSLFLLHQKHHYFHYSFFIIFHYFYLLNLFELISLLYIIFIILYHELFSLFFRQWIILINIIPYHYFSLVSLFCFSLFALFFSHY